MQLQENNVKTNRKFSEVIRGILLNPIIFLGKMSGEGFGVEEDEVELPKELQEVSDKITKKGIAMNESYGLNDYKKALKKDVQVTKSPKVEKTEHNKTIKLEDKER